MKLKLSSDHPTFQLKTKIQEMTHHFLNALDLIIFNTYVVLLMDLLGYLQILRVFLNTVVR